MELKKQEYLAPRIEVINVENEGIIASSVGIGGGYPGGGEPFSYGGSSHVKQQGSSSPLQDLEDAINDIFTVKK